jgi:hypothetical protein
MFVPSAPELRVASRPGHVRVMRCPKHRRVWQYEAVDHQPHQLEKASNLYDGIAVKQLLQGGQGARCELSQNECCQGDEYQLERYFQQMS